MNKLTVRAWSRYSQDASALLGALIRTARTERGMTAQQVAERVGISRGLLQRIEQGGLKSEIGVVFEAAAVVGVKLFDADRPTLARELHHAREKLVLLPRSVRLPSRAVDDDF